VLHRAPRALCDVQVERDRRGALVAGHGHRRVGRPGALAFPGEAHDGLVGDLASREVQPAQMLLLGRLARRCGGAPRRGGAVLLLAAGGEEAREQDAAEAERAASAHRLLR